MRVGTSISVLKTDAPYMDHPHACGDKGKAKMTEFKVGGSSPCVWGQVQGHVTIQTFRGIIPMRVGTRTSDVKNADGE